jgi:iron complex transport system ATP-binding protein
MKVELDDLTLGYGATPVVHGVDLTIETGRFVALVGANGSGKSTLLKSCYRALRPVSGRILLDGRDLWRMPHAEVARTVGVLGQDNDGGFDFTARESVMLGRYPHLGMFDRPRARDAEIVDEALRLAECEHLADRVMSALSGGERQRVLFARALAQQPSMLVLDEPTNHLDPEHQITVLRMAAAQGVTVLAALHSLDLAAQYSDLVVVLDRGLVVASGPPSVVFTPDTLRDHFRVDGTVLADPVTGRPRLLLRGLVH